MGILDGVRVLDLGWGWAGAVAGMFLADHGATVVRIEREGDPARRHPGGRVWLRGRKSVLLDLQTPEGQEAAKRLARQSDVLLAQAMPGELEGLGLGYDALAQENPRLIYCLITPWGEDGPYAHEPPHEHLVAARTGVYDQAGWRDGPTFIPLPIPSVAAALLALQGIGAALRVRERTGRGQRVATSLFAGALAVQPGMINAQRPLADRGFGVAARHPFGSTPFYRIYECADGEYLHFGCLTPRLIQNAIRALGLQELIASNPKFGDGRNIPDWEAREELIQTVARIMKQRPFAEWAALFEREDVPYARSQWTEELLDDPQVRHLGLVATVDDPEVGPMEQMGMPIFFHGAPGAVRGPAPLPGQHSEEVLRALRDGGRANGEPTSGDGVETTALPAQASVDGSGPPFADVRILDLSQVIAGPYGPAVLTDLGAQVVKVEPAGGENFRNLGGGYLGLNRGKRGIAVDLQRPEGREVAHRLARWADVVVENYRPGVMQRLGVDYATLARLNPRLIYVSVTAFGSTGPYAHRPGVDPLLQAMTGTERTVGGEHNPPVFLRIAVSDYIAALLNAAAISLALYHRERTGQGQYVETSLMQAGILVNSEAFTRYAGRPKRRLPDKGQHGFHALDRMYRTEDGWLFLAIEDDEGAWQRLVATPGFERLASDPRFATIEGRSAHDEALAAHLEETFRGKTTEAWLELLSERAVPCAPVIERYSQLLFNDVHAILNGYVVKREHADLGEIEQPGRFLSFSLSTVPWDGRAAPVLGQHTEEVLGEMGYSKAEIEALCAAGVVTAATAGRS